MAKAVRFDQYGSTDVLYIAEVEVPSAPPGEVVVEVRAAGINPGEASIRKGLLDAIFPASFPSGEGSDLAGVVTQIGKGVESFALGDDVLGWTDRRASHAEYVVVPEDQLVPKPPALSWEAAGSLYVVGVTAFAAVRAVDVGPGDVVAVSAAAGGVGGIASQLSRIRGADQVIGIASSPNHDWLRSRGITPVTYGDGLAQRVRDAAPAGVNAFIDTFGSEYVHLAIDLGVSPDRIDTIIARDAAAEVGAKTEGSAAASDKEVLAEMANLVASGEITLPIAATFPLERVRTAFEQVELRHTRGKIVLLPGGEGSG